MKPRILFLTVFFVVFVLAITIVFLGTNRQLNTTKEIEKNDIGTKLPEEVVNENILEKNLTNQTYLELGRSSGYSTDGEPIKLINDGKTFEKEWRALNAIQPTGSTEAPKVNFSKYSVIQATIELAEPDYTALLVSYKENGTSSQPVFYTYLTYDPSVSVITVVTYESFFILVPKTDKEVVVTTINQDTIGIEACRNTGGEWKAFEFGFFYGGGCGIPFTKEERLYWKNQTDYGCLAIIPSSSYGCSCQAGYKWISFEEGCTNSGQTITPN